MPSTFGRRQETAIPSAVQPGNPVAADIETLSIELKPDLAHAETPKLAAWTRAISLHSPSSSFVLVERRSGSALWRECSYQVEGAIRITLQFGSTPYLSTLASMKAVTCEAGGRTPRSIAR